MKTGEPNQKKSRLERNRCDPLYLHARREAWVILGVWLFFFIWVLGASSWSGYQGKEGETTLVLGFPAWVFWGIAVPWLGANVFTFWFCFFYMKDDPFFESQESEVPGGRLNPDREEKND